MRRPKVEITQVVADLESHLGDRFPSLRRLSAECVQDMSGTDNAYCYVNVFNIPEEKILEVEDAAYGFMRDISGVSGLAVCFFLHTPEETAKKFPEFAVQRSSSALESALLSLQRELPFPPPVFGSNCVFDSAARIGAIVQSFRSYPEPSSEFESDFRQDVAANDELCEAA